MNMRHIITTAISGLLLSCCSDNALRSEIIQEAASAATTTEIIVNHEFIPHEFIAIRLNDEDSAIVRNIVQQGSAATYSPANIAIPHPGLTIICICWTDADNKKEWLNLEFIWSKSKEKEELARLAEQKDNTGCMPPQIVLPDAAYKSLMDLPAIREAREKVRQFKKDFAN